MSKAFWVAVKAIVLDENDNILILYKSENEDVNPNSFDIPWWRVVWWEDLETAIIREIREEVGLDVVVKKLSRTRWFTKWDLHLVGITYVVSVIELKEILLSDEHTNYFWKTKNEIINGDFPEWLKQEINMI